jgi:hypothetical protein
MEWMDGTMDEGLAVARTLLASGCLIHGCWRRRDAISAQLP